MGCCPECGSTCVDWSKDEDLDEVIGECGDCRCRWRVVELVTILEHGEEYEEEE